MDEIEALVENLTRSTRIFATLDTLENLKKGGRIGGATAMVGTMLQFKPCLDLSSGEVVEAGRQRTRKKSLLWLREILENAGSVEDLCIIHGDAPDVEEFKERELLNITTPWGSPSDQILKTKFNNTETGIIKPSIKGIKQVIKNNVF